MSSPATCARCCATSTRSPTRRRANSCSPSGSGPLRALERLHVVGQDARRARVDGLTVLVGDVDGDLEGSASATAVADLPPQRGGCMAGEPPAELQVNGPLAGEGCGRVVP